MSVYLSVTTDHVRIVNTLPHVLKSLNLDLVTEVHVNLPKRFRNVHEYDQQHIQAIKNIDKKIKIFILDDDLGPIMKIIPTLQRITDPNAVIISIDDDNLYYAESVKAMLRKHDQYPNDVLTNFGIRFSRPQTLADRLLTSVVPPWSTSKHHVDLLVGATGVLYPRKSVTDNMINDIIEYSKVNEYCKFSDDFVISYVLYKYGASIRQTQIRCIRQDLKNKPFCLSYMNLHGRTQTEERYIECWNFFQRYNKHERNDRNECKTTIIVQ